MGGQIELRCRCGEVRGVAVDLIIPKNSNHLLVDWATRANIAPLLSGGVRIWQSPPPFHHAKIMVVDNEWCLIGSSNWDIRSFRLNGIVQIDGRLLRGAGV